MTAGKRTITVVDIGSNTVRACVYRVKDRASSFVKVVDVSKAVGLAGYVDESCIMSREGIDAGCRAVSKAVRVAELAGSDETIILATGAVRNCINTAQVVKALDKKAGHPVRVLSGEEEAFMSAAGASWSTGIGTGLFFDLGGGSTELADMRKGGIVGVDSIPVGTLSSRRGVSGTILPEAGELEAIETGFARLLGASPVHLSSQPAVVGVGGSMRLALKVARNLGGDDPGRVLGLADLNMILDRGIHDPESLYRLILKLKPARIHTFLPACAIARAIMHSTGCNEMTVSKAGLREGCLISEMSACLQSDFAGI